METEIHGWAVPTVYPVRRASCHGSVTLHALLPLTVHRRRVTPDSTAEQRCSAHDGDFPGKQVHSATDRQKSLATDSGGVFRDGKQKLMRSLEGLTVKRFYLKLQITFLLAHLPTCSLTYLLTFSTYAMMPFSKASANSKGISPPLLSI